MRKLLRFGTQDAAPPSVNKPPVSTEDHIFVQVWKRTETILKRLDSLEYKNTARAIVPGKTVAAAYAIQDNDGVILANAAGGVFAVTLPLAARSYGRVVSIKRLNPMNVVNVTCSGADLCDGLAVQVLGAQWVWVTVWSDGVAWYIIG